MSDINSPSGRNGYAGPASVSVPKETFDRFTGQPAAHRGGPESSGKPHATDSVGMHDPNLGGSPSGKVLGGGTHPVSVPMSRAGLRTNPDAAAPEKKLGDSAAGDTDPTLSGPRGA